MIHTSQRPKSHHSKIQLPVPQKLHSSPTPPQRPHPHHSLIPMLIPSIPPPQTSKSPCNHIPTGSLTTAQTLPLRITESITRGPIPTTRWLVATHCSCNGASIRRLQAAWSRRTRTPGTRNGDWTATRRQFDALVVFRHVAPVGFVCFEGFFDGVGGFAFGFEVVGVVGLHVVSLSWVQGGHVDWRLTTPGQRLNPASMSRLTPSS